MTNTTTTWTPAEVGLGRPRTTPTEPRRLRRGIAVAALGALAVAGTALAAAVTMHDSGAPSVPAVDGAVRPAASAGDRMSADALERRTEGGAARGASTCRSAPASADSYERCLAPAGG